MSIEILSLKSLHHDLLPSQKVTQPNDLILGSILFNKEKYRTSTLENGERRKIKDLIDWGNVREKTESHILAFFADSK
jgi:hypothetical protein